MTTFRNLAPALVAALGLSVCSVAVGYAQDAAAPAPQGADAGQHHWDRAAMKQHREEMRAEHAKVMHDALNIRPDQEAAFQAMIASTDGGHGEHMRHEGKGGAHGASLTTPERLDRMEKRMAERSEAFQRHAAAVKAFYAVLSPEQQRTFDALMKIGGHRGGHGMGGHHHGMGGPQGGPPPAQG